MRSKFVYRKAAGIRPWQFPGDVGNTPLKLPPVVRQSWTHRRDTGTSKLSVNTPSSWRCRRSAVSFSGANDDRPFRCTTAAEHRLSVAVRIYSVVSRTVPAQLMNAFPLCVPQLQIPHSLRETDWYPWRDYDYDYNSSSRCKFTCGGNSISVIIQYE